MTEADIMRRVQKKASELGWRLWRNNVGRLKDSRGVWITYGIQNPGGSDLIGFKRVTITPEMVGKQVAIFAAVEVKTDKGRLRPEQVAFLEFINSVSGIGIVARTEEDLK